MKQYNLSPMEEEFSYLIWSCEPISTKDLIKVAEKHFDWKRTTTYTMLKRLIDKDIFVNDNGTVYSKISQKDYEANKSQIFINESFDGSLPKFITAFVRKNKLSDADLKELKKLIQEYDVKGDK